MKLLRVYRGSLSQWRVAPSINKQKPRETVFDFKTFLKKIIKIMALRTLTVNIIQRNICHISKNEVSNQVRCMSVRGNVFI